VVTLRLPLIQRFITATAMTRVRIKDVLIAFLLVAPLIVLVDKLTLPLALVRVLVLNSQNDFLSNDSVKFHSHSRRNRLPVVNSACIGWSRSSAAS
jgi:hypothetical protein